MHHKMIFSFLIEVLWLVLESQRVSIVKSRELLFFAFQVQGILTQLYFLKRKQMKVNPEHEATSAVVFNELQHENQVLVARNKKLRIILGVIIFLSIVSIATTALVLRLDWGGELYQDIDDYDSTEQNDSPTNEEDDDKTDYNDETIPEEENDEEAIPEEEIPFCQKFAEKCEGVNGTIINFLEEKNYNNYEINSMLQLAKSYEEIGQGNSQQIYKGIFQSINCVSAIFGPTYLQNIEPMHNLYLTSPQKLDSYIAMVQEFNGKQIVSKMQDLYLSCDFLIQNSVYDSADNIDWPSSKRYENCQSSQRAALHFINGIGFTPKGTHKNLKAIKKAAYQKSLKFRYLVCSSPSRKQKGIIGDLVDAWSLKLQEQHQTSVDQRILKRLALHFHGDSLDEQSENFLSNSEYRDTILDEYNNLMYSHINNPETNYNVQNDVDEITFSFQFYAQVILVAHSHGAIYANNLHAKLDQKDQKSIAMVFLGTAAHQIADGYNLYITNEADLVIKSFRQIVDSSIEPLVGNVESTQYGLFHHSCAGYIETFNELFKSKLQTAYNLPLKPAFLYNLGDAINVFLFWDDIADLNLDLHVYEPEISGIPGMHLYYENTQGRTGYLSQLSTYEHFFVYCSDIQEGTYEFKLNYFAGNGVSSFQVIVTAGYQLKIIEGQTDSVPIGESGNSDPPISLFKIKVKRNEFYEHVEYEIIES